MCTRMLRTYCRSVLVIIKAREWTHPSAPGLACVARWATCCFLHHFQPGCFQRKIRTRPDCWVIGGREATAPYDPITLFTPHWHPPETCVIQIGVGAICVHLCECVCVFALMWQTRDSMQINVVEKQTQCVDAMQIALVAQECEFLSHPLQKKIKNKSKKHMSDLSVMLVCMNVSCQCWKSVDLCACPAVHAWICNASSCEPPVASFLSLFLISDG